MPQQCQICKQLIQRRVEVNGSKIILGSGRKTCLKCTPHSFNTGRRATSNRKIINGDIHRYCSRCHDWLNDSYYYKKTGLTCKKCLIKSVDVVAQQQKRIDLKLRAVQYLGSKCYKCQNTFPICVYSFHHRNPKEKDFQISRGHIWNTSIQTELDKCDLLCHNCHSIQHVKYQGSLQLP